MDGPLSGSTRRPYGSGSRSVSRSQNWLAREVGVSPGYISMLVNAGRTPSGRIRRRMLRALGFDDFDQLFTMEDRDDEP